VLLARNLYVDPKNKSQLSEHTHVPPLWMDHERAVLENSHSNCRYDAAIWDDQMNNRFAMIPTDGRILYFARDRASFRFLSHFYQSPIFVDGETWPTVEHYFQAQRSNDPTYREAIRRAVTPGNAERLAASPDAPRRISKQSWFRRHGMQPRADWRDVELDIMRRGDWAKFTQNPPLAEMLLATGSAELLEDSPVDVFWGQGPDGLGQNWAGRILMEIRDRLRSSK
jgi:N-glycosidase YbiA